MDEEMRIDLVSKSGQTFLAQDWPSIHPSGFSFTVSFRNDLITIISAVGNPRIAIRTHVARGIEV